MQVETISVLIASCIFYLIAEFIGRGKHIGKWWTLLLLLGGIIPGLIALVFSPSAINTPTKGTLIHTIAGWVFIILLGAIPLFITLNSLQEYLDYGIDINMKIGIPISFIVTGIYLIQLGKGKVININPKIYFDNQLNDIKLPTITNTFKLDTNTQYLYYIIENNVQSEPQTFVQLKDKKILEDTLVWRNGLADWSKAKDVKELHSIILFSPPPIPNTSTIITNNDIMILNENYKKEQEELKLQKDSKLKELKSSLSKNVKYSIYPFLLILPFAITLISNDGYDPLTFYISNNELCPLKIISGVLLFILTYFIIISLMLYIDICYRYEDVKK